MFFEVNAKSLFGGVGRRMINGFSMWREGGGSTIEELLEYEGIVRLARLGPFMPPMTAPDRLSPCRVVSQEFRIELEKSDLTRSPIRFQPVIKEHIVEFHWEQWDRKQGFPDVEFNCDPDEFIEMQPHSESAAAGLGEIWEARFPACTCLHLGLDSRDAIDLTAWDGSHVFAACWQSQSARMWGGLYADEVGMHWLQERTGEFVDFEPIRSE